VSSNGLKVYDLDKTKNPRKTTIEISFPNGETVTYESDNVILEDFTKEYIIENKLFPYIPFYITRYENEIAGEGNIDNAISDLDFVNQVAESFTQAVQ
jgi:hypothetical protein